MTLLVLFVCLLGSVAVAEDGTPVRGLTLDRAELNLAPAAYGDTLEVVAHVRVNDRVGNTPLTLGVDVDGFRTAHHRRADSQGLRIGGVYPVNFRFPFLPQPKSGALPIWDHGTTATFTVDGKRVGSPDGYPLESLPMVHLGQHSVSANPDYEGPRDASTIASIAFPDGEPALFPGATGTVYSELTDGLLTGSGNPYVESVYWSGDWGEDEKRIILHLTAPTSVNKVILAVPSPYPNYTVDEAVVDVVTADGESVPFGSGQQPWGRTHSGVFLCAVKGSASGVLSVHVKLRKKSGATHIPVSEIYVFGS